MNNVIDPESFRNDTPEVLEEKAKLFTEMGTIYERLAEQNLELAKNVRRAAMCCNLSASLKRSHGEPGGGAEPSLS